METKSSAEGPLFIHELKVHRYFCTPNKKLQRKEISAKISHFQSSIRSEVESSVTRIHSHGKSNHLSNNFESLLSALLVTFQRAILSYFQKYRLPWVVVVGFFDGGDVFVVLGGFPRRLSVPGPLDVILRPSAQYF